MSLLRFHLSLPTRQLATVVKRSYMDARYENNRKIPQGLTVKTLKHHYALVPLFFIMSLAMTWVVVFSARSLFKMHDVSLTKQEEPWERYRHKQFRFVKHNIVKQGKVDYETACKAPEDIRCI